MRKDNFDLQARIKGIEYDILWLKNSNEKGKNNEHIRVLEKAVEEYKKRLEES